MCDVSIIVPIYKGKKYIESIIKMIEKNVSHLNDVYEFPKKVEVIFVNDYPLENIKIGIYLNKGFEIRVLDNGKNVGIQQARINGLNIAKGQHILFLDQDDTIEDNYLVSQMKHIGNADAVLCNGIWRGNKRIYRDEEEHKLAISKAGYYPQKTWLVSPGQLLIKKSFIPDEWINNVLKNSGSDDALLWLLMLREDGHININPEVLYFHNEDGDNTSFNFYKMSQSIKEMMDIIEENDFFAKDDLEIIKKGQMIRINRYDSYEAISEKWNTILDNVRRLIRNKDGQIAVYGYGIIGKRLLEDLKKSELEIDIIIDKDAQCYEDHKRKCFALSDIQEEISVVIVTPIFDKDKIYQNLKTNPYIKKIVMIDEL